jgi:hypothetical protein
MGVAAIAMALVAAQSNTQQAVLGAELERLNANEAGSIANVISQAAHNGNSLANVATGVGANLNISA